MSTNGKMEENNKPTVPETISPIGESSFDSISSCFSDYNQERVELPIDDGQTEMDEEQTLALESTEE
jgi:hypothetical protein